MKKDIVMDYLVSYGENELFFVETLYRNHFSREMTEAAYYKMVERLCHEGLISKIAKGTYYKPKMTKYGAVPLSNHDIISFFTQQNKGMEIGYTMYNQLGLTTQVSKEIQLLSSNLSGKTKRLRDVYVTYADIEFNEENKKMIQMLEILQNYRQIQDIRHSAALDYFQAFSAEYSDCTFEDVISCLNYKKSTIAFLREILNHFEKENRLNYYLSALSDYKHPSMEELYEAARIS